jgi:hypothetical protein
MKEIDIFKYNSKDISNCSYDVPVKLVIRKFSYELAKKLLKIKKNQSTIYFDNVIFKKEVSLNFDEGVEEEITISFGGCFIDSFNSFAVTSKNITFTFFNCINNHFISKNKNVKAIQINNSFGTYFISNTENLRISFTENNIVARDWHNKNTSKKILSQKTRFHIEDVEKTNISGSELTKERKIELLRLQESFYPEETKVKGKYRFKRLLSDEEKSVLKESFTESELKKTKVSEYLKDYKIFYAEEPYQKWKYKLKRLLTDEEKLLLDITIDLKYSAEFNHEITRVQTLPLRALSLSGKPKGEISIEDSKIDNIYIRNFSPKTDFTLYNIEPRTTEESKFEVHDSNMDNTWFNSVKLKSYFVVFHKSSFVNTKFYSTIFPPIKDLLNSNKISSVKNIHYPDQKSNKIAFNRDMYELFLELKQAFEKRGNIFEAQKMKAVAHDFLFKIEGNNFVKSDFWNNKAVLLLNRLSNFHGISIRNAIISIVMIVFLFQWLNILSFKSYVLGFNSWVEVWNIFWNTKRYMFAIANPTHRISSLAPESELTGYTYMISFLSRIFIGYVYYQFIAAFRRFGK